MRRRPCAILASNTSVIPITRIMARLRNKSRALGTHWWNRPIWCRWVEVIRTVDTSDAANRRDAEASCLGRKKPRLRSRKTCRALSVTAFSMRCGARPYRSSPTAWCDAKTVDDVVKASFGARLAVLGPLENADLVGTDLTRSIHNYVLPALDRSTAASSYLDRLVETGRLGFKSGEGFRRWSPEQQASCASA